MKETHAFGDWLKIVNEKPSWKEFQESMFYLSSTEEEYQTIKTIIKRAETIYLPPKRINP